MAQEYVRLREAANRIGYTPATIRKWAKSGKYDLELHRLGNRDVVSVSQVDALLAGSVVNKKAASA
jgi:hypothetical protein